MLNDKVNVKKDERNYGIDLLRILAMLSIVIIHSLYKSNALDIKSVDYDVFSIAWLLEILLYGAVNVFALISGYMGFKEKKQQLNIKKIVRLWTQAVFYGLASYIIVLIVNYNLIKEGDLERVAMPVLHGTYWYLTAYIAMYLASPIINAGIRELDKKNCRRAVWLCLGVFSFLQIVSNDIFQLNNGYSVIWLIILYFIGGAIKKGCLFEKLSKKRCCIGVTICVLITWITLLLGNSFQFLGFTIKQDFLVNYTSPTIVLASIMFVYLFVSLRIKRRWLVKTIKWTTPCLFAVYLLNCNIYIWRYYLVEWLSPVREIRTMLTIPLLLLFSLVFFVVAILIEKVRLVVVSYIINQKQNKTKSLDNNNS